MRLRPKTKNTANGMIQGILDTEILSEIGKGINANVLQNVSDYLDEYEQLTFTSISVYEQLYGFKIKGATKQIQDFLELIAEHEEIVPETEDYRVAAEIRAAMHLAGTPIGSIDPIIATCAIRRGLPLITGNMRHHGQFKAPVLPCNSSTGESRNHSRVFS